MTPDSAWPCLGMLICTKSAVNQEKCAFLHGSCFWMFLACVGAVRVLLWGLCSDPTAAYRGPVCLFMHRQWRTKLPMGFNNMPSMASNPATPKFSTLLSYWQSIPNSTVRCLAWGVRGIGVEGKDSAWTRLCHCIRVPYAKPNIYELEWLLFLEYFGSLSSNLSPCSWAKAD